MKIDGGKHLLHFALFDHTKVFEMVKNATYILSFHFFTGVTKLFGLILYKLFIQLDPRTI